MFRFRPHRARQQVVAFGEAGGGVSGAGVAGGRRGPIARALQQVTAHGVQAVVAGQRAGRRPRRPAGSARRQGRRPSPARWPGSAPPWGCRRCAPAPRIAPGSAASRSPPRWALRRAGRRSPLAAGTARPRPCGSVAPSSATPFVDLRAVPRASILLVERDQLAVRAAARARGARRSAASARAARPPRASSGSSRCSRRAQAHRFGGQIARAAARARRWPHSPR